MIGPYGQYMMECIRNCQTLPKISVPFCLQTSDIGVCQLFLYVSCVLYPKKYIPKPRLERFFLVFSSRISAVLEVLHL